MNIRISKQSSPKRSFLTMFNHPLRGSRTAFLAGWGSLPQVVLTLVLLAAPLAYAQTTSATLSGTVVDTNAASVPGANVTLADTAKGFERKVATSSEGTFIIPLLPPSNYTLTIAHTGFTTVQVPNIILNVGDQKAVQISLKVGDVSAKIEVRAEENLINESPGVGAVVDRQFVGNLPLNGRSFQSLITLSPGVVLTAASPNNQGQFSVNGQRTSANYFTIDGAGANIGSTGSAQPSQAAAGSVAAFSATGGTNNLLSVDALQEFKIQTSSYAPEFGRTPGAQISLTSRSGTNAFNLAIFEYVRNDALDANDWFANRSGLKRPPLRQHSFGGVFGGPVMLPDFSGRNRTFFFLSYEGLRLQQPQVASNVPVPSTALRDTAPAELRPFLNAFPVPNGPSLVNGLASFSASFSNKIQQDATSLRVDHAFSDKLTLFGRYNYSPSYSVTRGALALSNPLTSTSDTKTLTIGSTFTPSAKLFNDLRVNYSTNNVKVTYSLDDFGGAKPADDSIFFPSYTNREVSFVAFVVGASNTSLFNGLNANNFQKQINLVDTLSVLSGPHQLKFGVDYRRLEPTLGTTQYSIAYQFTGFTGPGGAATSGTILSGRMAAAQVGHRSGNTYPLFNNYSLFAQDTWKASKRVTLTYGLRWEINPPPTEAEGRSPFTVVGLENPATMTLSEQGAPLWKTRFRNFAPRFGAAYQLFSGRGRETVLRGGIGTFYDLGTDQAANGIGGFPYLNTRLFPAATPFPLTSVQLDPPPHDPNIRPVGGIYAFGPDFRTPRVYQWNATIEQSLGRNQTFTAAYVGAAGRDLLRLQLFANPNPTFTSVAIVDNSARSDYHAAQFQFQRRLTHGIQALASYTWGKSTDTASDDSTFLAPSQRYDPNNDRGPSDFDIRHAFNAAMTYDIPTPFQARVARAILGNWSLDAIVAARSAPPINVTVTRNIGFGSFAFRPDLVPGIPVFIDDPNAGGGRRINDTVVPGSPNQRGPFLVSSQSRQGTLGRNALRGFAMNQVDLGVRRRFKFGERMYLQLKAEFFNIFNHPNFANPSGNLGSVSATNVLVASPTFGRSAVMLGRSLGGSGISAGLNPLYQIGGPRSIQLSARFGF